MLAARASRSRAFFELLGSLRKLTNYRCALLQVVVGMHNAVNERSWNHVLEWERTLHPRCTTHCAVPCTPVPISAEVEACCLTYAP